MRFFLSHWLLFTQDKTILSWVKGYKLPLLSTNLQGGVTAGVKKLSVLEFNSYKLAVEKLIRKGVITKCKPVHGQFLSHIFLVPKPDKSNRLILNLKSLNRYMVAPHFKLDNFKSVRDLITKNVFMTTVDLKDAYYMVPIFTKHRKFLRFSFDGDIFEFNCMPMGLTTAPYVFTKLLKPVFNQFRREGIICLIYLDDILILGSAIDEVQKTTEFVINTLQNLGFIINFKKSQLQPTQSARYLGFVYNSRNMTMRLPDDKKLTISDAVNSFAKRNTCKIRELAKITGLLVSACPAVQYGWLYVKRLERQKFLALKSFNGNYDAKLNVSKTIKEELQWWSQNIKNAYVFISSRTFKYEIFTDASKTGWGAACGSEIARGFWGEQESSSHINILELSAILYALQSFVNDDKNCDILLRVDNKTAIAYINKMGGIQFTNLNNLSRKIWRWCEARGIMLYAAYIPSKENNVADTQSRNLSMDSEYSLSDNAFSKIVARFGEPSIDLFASHLNKKCDTYISWLKNPGALTSDAFTIKWNKSLNFYAFPPFSIIGRVLKKIVEDKAFGILVVPYWPNQPWFSLFLKLCTAKPLFFNPKRNLILSPFRTTHPIWKNISLVASKLSGDRL